jgi:hypothetical protein
VVEDNPEAQSDARKGDRDGEEPDSYSGELFHPGHRLNVSVERNPDLSTHGGKPWLVISERKRHRYPPVAFDTAEQANKHAEESVRRADRGLKDDDRSLWD